MIAFKELPDQKILHDVLKYNPSTGELKYNNLKREYFNSDKNWKQWNKLCAGNIAGSKDRKLVRILGERYCINRVIYKWMTNKEPGCVIYNDFDSTNLKWSNLKGYNSESINKIEHLRTKRTKSGEKGVFWHKSQKKWMTNIGINGHTYYGGSFDNFKDAVKNRKDLEKRFYREDVI